MPSHALLTEPGLNSGNTFPCYLLLHLENPLLLMMKGFSSDFSAESAAARRLMMNLLVWKK